MRLRAQLIVVLAAVALGPLLVAGPIATDIAVREAKEKAHEGLLRDAESRATFVSTWIADQAEFLGGWMTLFPRLSRQPHDQQTALLRSVFRSLPWVVTVALVDTEGDPLVDPVWLPVDPGGRDPLAGRELGTAARAQRFLSRIPLPPTGSQGALLGVANRDQDASTSSVSIGVKGPYGDDAVLGAEISLAEVSALLSLGEEGDRSVALLHTDGRAILGADSPLIDSARLTPLLSVSATFHQHLEDGKEVHGAIARVPNTDWAVVVVEPADVANSTSEQIQLRMLILIGLSILVAVLLAAIWARSFSGPVQELSDAAGRVALGGVGVQVQEAGPGEVRELARAFNDMSIRLQLNRREIETQKQEIIRANEELESRVEQRTQELKEAQSGLIQSGQLAAVAELGAGLAHELNNPLAGILGLTQVLRAKHQGSSDEELLHMVEEQAIRCREVVDLMLRLSASEEDSASIQTVDVGDLMREVASLVDFRFRERGIRLSYTEPKQALSIRINRVQGTRIVAQILNALRAGLEEGATVTVSSSRTDDMIALVLSPDCQIAEGGARDDWMASGMSLWVARKMLDQVGGTIVEPSPLEMSWRLLFPAVVHDS